MFLRIEQIPPKRLVGRQRTISLISGDLSKLWQSFMPRLHEISNRQTSDLVYLREYPDDYFTVFDPARSFVAWALAEVQDFSQVPAGMSRYELHAGEYAVFLHKGANTNQDTFQYIFTEWLPDSEFVLDDRPHFDLLGAKYQNNEPTSEEEIWIPVRTDS